jgi:hypothetical protein
MPLDSEGDQEPVDDVCGSGPGREPSPDELEGLVGEVFAVSEDWTALPHRLITAAIGAGFDADGPGVAAARHGTRVVLRRKDEPARRPEVVLEPLMFPVDGREATRPWDADPAAAALLRLVADTAHHPAARARFLDLLVLRGGPRTPADAAAAARACLDLAVLGAYEISAAEGPDGQPGGGLTATRVDAAQRRAGRRKGPDARADRCGGPGRTSDRRRWAAARTGPDRGGAW